MKKKIFYLNLLVLFLVLILFGCNVPNLNKNNNSVNSLNELYNAPITENINISYTIDNDWGSGYVANITIANNTGSAIDGWTLEWTFDGNQTITNFWNTELTQSGQDVTASNAGYNSTIPSGESVSFGFQGNYSGVNNIPTNFTLSGNQQSSSSSSSVSSSSSSSISSSISSSSSSISDKMIPGLIEAENFDNMSGIDTEPCTEGGLNVGWFNVGDWVEYEVYVETTEAYTAEFRLASLNNIGNFQFQVDGAVLFTVIVPDTDGWQNWTSEYYNLNLSEGNHTIRLYSTGEEWNINWFNITRGSSSSSSSSSSYSSSPFYAERSRGEWTLVVIPDTQHYTDPADDGKAPFANMKTGFEWIVSMKDDLNIKMVQSLGDITDWNEQIQWDRGAECYYMLYDNNIPFAPNQGNHDDIAKMNEVFPLSIFRSLPWWGGDSGGIENSYQLMTIGNEEYLFLNVESFDQYTEKRWFAMDWAKGVLADNPNKKVILATHNNWDTTDIREHLLYNYSNIVMSNSGHTGAREEYFITTPNGGLSHNFITDYQHDDYETMLIRYYIFKPLEDKIYYYTYSPVTKEFEADDNSQGAIDMVQAD